MKNLILILAMLLTAATAFTQTSRRSANSPAPAREEKEKSTATTDKKEIANRRSATPSVNSSTPVRRETTTRQSSVSTQSRPKESIQQTTGTSRREATTRQSSTAAQSRPQESNQQTTGNTRREATTRQPNTAAQSRPANNPQAPNTARRGTGSTQSHNDNKPANTNVNRNQAVHQQRSANHTVRTAPRGSNSGTKYGTYYESPRVYRDTRVIKYHYNAAPRNRYYRARHYPYRTPVSINVYWTPSMRFEYAGYYPMVTRWRYTDGYRIPTVSAYDAMFYHGEVMNVYGKVYEVFYTGRSDEYILYFGAYYPYHDFSVVLPGWIARRLSRWPEEYFERQHVIVTGLVTTFENKPEVVVRNTGQVRIY